MKDEIKAVLLEQVLRDITDITDFKFHVMDAGLLTSTTHEKRHCVSSS